MRVARVAYTNSFTCHAAGMSQKNHTDRKMLASSMKRGGVNPCTLESVFVNHGALALRVGAKEAFAISQWRTGGLFCLQASGAGLGT